MENEQRIKIQEIDAAAAASTHPNPNLNQAANMRKTSTTNEMIKELKKRNPNGGGVVGAGDRRTRQQSKKEINIEDLIEEINRGYITADAERRKRQRTQEIKKDFVKTSTIQIV